MVLEMTVNCTTLLNNESRGTHISLNYDDTIYLEIGSIRAVFQIKQLILSVKL